MITNNTKQFIQKLAQREEVTSHFIQEIITTTFRNSYCQNENKNADLHFEFNDDLLVYRVYQIVEKVNDPVKEITRDDQLIAEGKIKDNIFFWPVDTKKISFSLSQEIKKELDQNLKKIHKEKEYKIYSPLQGQIVSGYLQSIADDHYVINLGKGYGYWEKKEQPFLEEKLHLGQKLFLLLKEVRKEGNYCRIILTRRHDLFLQKVLELEIPEVKNKIIIIRDILHLTDSLSKIIIESKNPQLNVLGTCIGKDATRIRSICQITYPERVEIVRWQENKKELFFNLLAPTQVISLIEKGDNWEVIVPNSRMSLILANGGEAITVIGNYLGKNIHFQTLEEWEEKEKNIIIWNGNLSFEDYQSKK